MSKLGTLLGIRVVEDADTYKLIRVPMWASSSMINKAIEKVEADAKVAGLPVRITKGDRLIRVDYLDV